MLSDYCYTGLNIAFDRKHLMNLMIQPGTKPLAFSYVRLSSRTQRNGDGHRRQTDLAAAYCEEEGLVLDHALEDIGVSGFSGANRLRGVLSRFLDLVRSGRIPRGSCLIVESLDRLSRDKVLIAQRLFTDVLEAGIDIVTLADKRKYTWEEVNTDAAQLIISLSIMLRAHDESRMKLVRQREKWTQKRANGRAGGQKLTARCPTWLTLNEDGTDFHIDEGRKRIINRMFQEAEQGIGCDAIARRLNADKIAPFSHGRTWHGGTVRKYLTSSAVRGHYQPHRMEVVMSDGERTTKRVPDGPIIEGYYPWIIDEDQWNRTWAAMDSRRMAGAPNLAGRKGSKIANLFGQLATCSHCNQPINIRDRGQKRRNRAFMLCAGARTGTCTNTNQYVVNKWEPAILEFVSELDLRDVDPIEIQTLDSTVAGMKARCHDLSKKLDAYLDMVAEQNSARARQRAADTERELDTLQAELNVEEEKLRRMRAASPPEHRQEQMKLLMAKMTSADAKELYATRAALQQSLRDLVHSIRFGGREATVILKGTRIGYIFKDAALLRRREFDNPVLEAEIAPDYEEYVAEVRSRASA